MTAFPGLQAPCSPSNPARSFRLRLEKFAKQEDGAESEACLMVNEKIAAAFEASGSLFAGATPAAIIDRYREHVAANVEAPVATIVRRFS